MNRRPGRRPCLCKLQIAAERRHGHLAGSPQLRAYQSSVRPLPRAAPFAPPKVKTVLRRRRGPVSSAFYLDLANKEPGAAAGRVVTVNSMEEVPGWVGASETTLQRECPDRPLAGDYPPAQSLAGDARYRPIQIYKLTAPRA